MNVDLKMIFSIVLSCTYYMNISNSNFRKYLKRKTFNRFYKGYEYYYAEEYKEDIDDFKKVGDGW